MAFLRPECVFLRAQLWKALHQSTENSGHWNTSKDIILTFASCLQTLCILWNEIEIKISLLKDQSWKADLTPSSNAKPPNIERSPAHCSLSSQNTQSDSSPAPSRRKEHHTEMLRGLQQTSSLLLALVRLIPSVTVLYHTSRKGDSFSSPHSFSSLKNPLSHKILVLKKIWCAFLFQCHILCCSSLVPLWRKVTLPRWAHGRWGWSIETKSAVSRIQLLSRAQFLSPQANKTKTLSLLPGPTFSDLPTPLVLTVSFIITEGTKRDEMVLLLNEQR